MITLQLDERELRLLIELMSQEITSAVRVGEDDPSSLHILYKKLADAEVA